jgi:hypothetical protein
MTAKAIKLTVVAVLALLVTLILIPRNTRKEALPETSGGQIPAGWLTYRNDTYGFEISYPGGASPTTTFERYYHLADTWRADAPAATSGTPIVSIPLYRIANTGVYRSYPLYFNAEVRVGASADSRDLTTCLQLNPYFTNDTSTPVTINGTVFMQFPLESGGMSQYMAGESYRAVHNGECFAIERLKTGANYRDATSTNDIPDATLNSYYDRLVDIVDTFRFTK